MAMAMTDDELFHLMVRQVCDDDLSADDAAALHAATDRSPELVRRLRELRHIAEGSALARSAPPPALVDRVIAMFGARAAEALRRPAPMIARLVFDSRSRPALAGFRGAAEAGHLAFEAEPNEIELQVIAVGRPPVQQWRLRGQIEGDGAGGAGVELHPSGASELLCGAAADERGCFRLTASAGRYDLHLRLGERTVVLPDLAVG